MNVTANNKTESQCRDMECLLNVFCGLFNTNKLNSARREKNLDDILDDTGNGIVSKGMIFLELLSSCIRRNNVSAINSLELSKDAPIIAFINNTDITEEKKPEITIKSLGIEGLAETLEEKFPERYEIFRHLMADVYDRVSEGLFYRRSHRALMPYLMNCATRCKKEEEEVRNRIDNNSEEELHYE